jgi:hypothetical protein
VVTDARLAARDAARAVARLQRQLRLLVEVAPFLRALVGQVVLPLAPALVMDCVAPLAVLLLVRAEDRARPPCPLAQVVLPERLDARAGGHVDHGMLGWLGGGLGGLVVAPLGERRLVGTELRVHTRVALGLHLDGDARDARGKGAGDERLLVERPDARLVYDVLPHVSPDQVRAVGHAHEAADAAAGVVEAALGALDVLDDCDGGAEDVRREARGKVGDLGAEALVARLACARQRRAVQQPLRVRSRD